MSQRSPLAARRSGLALSCRLAARRRQRLAPRLSSRIAGWAAAVPTSMIRSSVLGYGLAAVTLVGSAAAVDPRLFTDRPDDAAVATRAPAPATAAPDARPDGTPGRSATSAMDPQRFLLNALLAPAIDPDSVPPAWVDPRPILACAAGSSIRIDGRALAAGERVPTGQFIVDWQAVGCRPFGLAGPRLDGSARLIVDGVADAWTAIVLPEGMAFTGADGRVQPLIAGRVRMPLSSMTATAQLAGVNARQRSLQALPR